MHPALLLLALALAADAGPRFAEDVGPFLKKHCVSCHGPDKQASGIRLDRADGYRAAEAPLWTKVHEALLSGSMPPAGRARPPGADAGRVRAWVEGEQAGTKAGLRRLNRRELAAALRDVTGLAVDYAHALPADGTLGGFDTGAEALQDSADHVDQVMKVTRRAVDALRFLGPPPGKPLVGDFRGSRDPRKLLDEWRKLGHIQKARGTPLPGKGLLLQPYWVGERDVITFAVPAPEGGRGVLRLRLLVSALKPMAGLPNPRLWVSVGGHAVDHAEVTASFEEPRELVYEVQLDDLPIGKTVKVNLSTKVEIPYAVKGYENQEMTRPGETPPPGGTGLFRPAFDRKLPPEKQPAPFIVLQRLEMDAAHVAAWGGANADSDEEAERLLAAWTDRAWRRPTSPEERRRFFNLYRKLRGEKATFDDALRAAFQGVLMSGGFRYLHPSDLASRLSFLLWGTPPDAELRKAAAKLREPAVLEAQVSRLLADPRADGFFRPFVSQWLELEQPITIASASLKKQDFRFARNLKEAMREQTVAYISRLFTAGRPASELIQSNWTMMNDALAIHLGHGGVEGGHMREVKLKADDPRGGGILGHAGIQSMLCWMGGNWVIYRGAWAMRHVLDDPPPPPPLEVPELNPNDKANHGKTFKQLLKIHQSDANCSVCHKKMDPIGFAFQNFDISGRWRDREHDAYHMADLDGKIEWRGTGKDRPVDAEGRLPRGEAFKSFAEAKALIVKHYQDDMVRGILKNLVINAAGRLPDVHDMAEIRRILREQRAKGYPLDAVLKELLKSKSFLER